MCHVFSVYSIFIFTKSFSWYDSIVICTCNWLTGYFISNRSGYRYVKKMSSWWFGLYVPPKFDQVLGIQITVKCDIILHFFLCNMYIIDSRMYSHIIKKCHLMRSVCRVRFEWILSPTLCFNPSHSLFR